MASQQDELLAARSQLKSMMAEWARPKGRSAYLVIRLGVIDSLMPIGTKKTASKLASELNAHAKPLSRVLRAAGQAGLLVEHEDGTFALTLMGSLLAANDPSKARAGLLTWNLPLHQRPLVHLHETVLHNKPSIEFAYGEGADFFELLYKDEFELNAFNQAMTASAGFGSVAVLSYDYSACYKVVDVGGCEGALLAAVLKKYPGCQGVNMDRLEVVDMLPPVSGELAGRLTHVAGDFFKPFPPEARDADAIIMKAILHEWSDELCITILQHCIDALSRNGKIIIIDQIMPDTAGLPAGSVSMFPFAVDLFMMALTPGGCERTLKEWTELFAAAGLASPTVSFNKDIGCLVTQPLRA